MHSYHFGFSLLTIFAVSTLNVFLAHFLIMRKRALLYSLCHHIYIYMCVCVCLSSKIANFHLRRQLAFAFAFKRTIMRKCALCDSPQRVQINFLDYTIGRHRQTDYYRMPMSVLLFLYWCLVHLDYAPFICQLVGHDVE